MPGRLREAGSGLAAAVALSDVIGIFERVF